MNRRGCPPAGRARRRLVVGEAGGPSSNELGDLLRWFARRPTPRLIAAFGVGATANRAARGRLQWSDAAVAAAVVAAQPLTEFLIHTRLLHRRPTQLLGRTIDPIAAREHRAHHADPNDLELVFIPLPTLVVGLAAVALGATVPSGDKRLVASGLVAGSALLAGYEWTHFLIHTGYRPRHGWFRSRWRTHRLHHYRNEHYWFGVTTHLADQLLGTMPDRSAVPPSPTARALESTPA